MKIQPFIIVPNLIEQPTWGGKYIVKHKKLTNEKLASKNIGQSYELYEFSNLSTKNSTKQNPSIELGDSKDPQKSQKITSEDRIFSINELIKLDPQKVLGKKSFDQFGPRIKTLIKFTQAKGNSYQIHVKEKTSKWLSKPESWYYFEPGLVTLGVKESTNWKEYQDVCLAINKLAKELSEKLETKKTSLDQARKELKNFIDQNPPEKFVNLVEIKKDQAIDLSACGIHHSWEENKKIAPNGNIVYEVQENVYDPVSTIRSFDKGKIKDDGTIRQLQINDYFKYIDRSLWANQPENHLIKTKLVKNSKESIVKQVFSSKKYSMQQINFLKQFKDKTTDSFHHLFVKKGQVEFSTENVKLLITQGFSVFVPASIGSYQLSAEKTAEILKTYI